MRLVDGVSSSLGLCGGNSEFEIKMQMPSSMGTGEKFSRCITDFPVPFPTSTINTTLSSYVRLCILGAPASQVNRASCPRSAYPFVTPQNIFGLFHRRLWKPWPYRRAFVPNSCLSVGTSSVNFPADQRITSLNEAGGQGIFSPILHTSKFQLWVLLPFCPGIMIDDHRSQSPLQSPPKINHFRRLGWNPSGWLPIEYAPVVPVVGKAATSGHYPLCAELATTRASKARSRLVGSKSSAPGWWLWRLCIVLPSPTTHATEPAYPVLFS